jgi:hypothetical protein
MLNSWRNRYLAGHPNLQVERESRMRLQEIARELPLWAKRFGNLDQLSVEQMELQFWRYETETIEHTGRSKTNYFRVRYEELADNPLRMSERIYDYCDLRLHDRIREQVSLMSAESGRVAAAWEEKLPATLIRDVQDVLARSITGDWWPDSSTARTSVNGPVDRGQSKATEI